MISPLRADASGQRWWNSSARLRSVWSARPPERWQTHTFKTYWCFRSIRFNFTQLMCAAFLSYRRTFMYWYGEAFFSTTRWKPEGSASFSMDVILTKHQQLVEEQQVDQLTADRKQTTMKYSQTSVCQVYRGGNSVKDSAFLQSWTVWVLALLEDPSITKWSLI